eukprot:1063480-Pleurochrysis_carterae.AAC.1
MDPSTTTPPAAPATNTVLPTDRGPLMVTSALADSCPVRKFPTCLMGLSGSFMLKSSYPCPSRSLCIRTAGWNR